LYELVAGKDYFVITTNVDHCFQRAGFDKKRLFYTQGDYGLFQCSKPCSNTTWDNEEIIRMMYDEQKDMKIPSYLVPSCPKCKRPLTMNLRADDRFAEDEGWHEAAARYESFLRTRRGKILFLELGVGYNTPIIIKIPFIKMTTENPEATYACVNLDEAVTTDDIKERSILINNDIDKVITDILKAKP
jgi:NAD-dependent SIR2 family protein deacetylase